MLLTFSCMRSDLRCGRPGRILNCSLCYRLRQRSKFFQEHMHSLVMVLRIRVQTLGQRVRILSCVLTGPAENYYWLFHRTKSVPSQLMPHWVLW